MKTPVTDWEKRTAINTVDSGQHPHSTENSYILVTKRNERAFQGRPWLFNKQVEGLELQGKAD